MKILLYTDNHFCQSSSIVRTRGERFSSRLENQIQSINWAEEQAEVYNCDMIVHLGDFFDRPMLNAEELTALKEIKWSNKNHYFMVGNHEMGTSNLEYNSVNVLSKVGTVIDKPTMTSGFGYELLFLPYVLESDRKPLSEYISKVSSEYWQDMFTTQEVKQLIILSHNDIKGIRYGQYESRTGFELEEIVDNCSLFVNGHLHNQTQINDKVLNLGNLTGLNFSEDAYKYSHCIGILDTDTLKIDLINNPHAFNFYKLEIRNREDLDKLKDLKENAVLSITTTEMLSNDVTQALIDNNIKWSRKMIEYNIVSDNNEIEQLVTSDHITQFKDFVHEQLGTSEIIEDELARL